MNFSLAKPELSTYTGLLKILAVIFAMYLYHQGTDVKELLFLLFGSKASEGVLNCLFTDKSVKPTETSTDGK